jgi:hypothetical protein
MPPPFAMSGEEAFKSCSFAKKAPRRGGLRLAFVNEIHQCGFPPRFEKTPRPEPCSTSSGNFWAGPKVGNRVWYTLDATVNRHVQLAQFEPDPFAPSLSDQDQSPVHEPINTPFLVLHPALSMNRGLHRVPFRVHNQQYESTGVGPEPDYCLS